MMYVLQVIKFGYHMPVFIVAESQELCSVLTDNRATRIVSHQISFETK